MVQAMVFKRPYATVATSVHIFSDDETMIQKINNPETNRAYHLRPLHLKIAKLADTWDNANKEIQMKKVNEIRFTTDRINQGQIVTYSHAETPRGKVIVRRHDASDNAVSYYWKATKRALTAAQREKYGL